MPPKRKATAAKAEASEEKKNKDVEDDITEISKTANKVSKRGRNAKEPEAKDAAEDTDKVLEDKSEDVDDDIIEIDKVERKARHGKNAKESEVKATKKKQQKKNPAEASKVTIKRGKRGPPNASDDETLEEVEKPKRGKRGAVKVNSENELEEEETEKPKHGPVKANSENGDEEVEKPKSSKHATLKASSSEKLDDEAETEKPKGGKLGPIKADNESEADEEEEVKKPKRGNRGRYKANAEDKPEEGHDVEKPNNSRGKKESGTKILLNQIETAYAGMSFSCDKPNKQGKTPNFCISSWNVDGLRAWLKKSGLAYLEYEKPDVFCLQETKCSTDKLPSEIKDLAGYKQYWHNSTKEGYAGVGLFSLLEPISVNYGIGNEDQDGDGRCITAEYANFYVVSVYVPNAGRKLVTLPKRLHWNTVFKKYIKGLDKKKPVIICGDMNVAHNEIDLANPKTNAKNAGFTKEEREGLTDFLKDGYIDSFRSLYPDQKDVYTFWSYMTKARAKNIGWRLDYFIVSKRFLDNICDNIVRNEVFGSDHCPISLFLNI